MAGLIDQMHMAVIGNARDFWERHYLMFGEIEDADRAVYSWWLRFGHGFPIPSAFIYIRNLEEN